MKQLNPKDLRQLPKETFKDKVVENIFPALVFLTLILTILWNVLKYYNILS